MFINDVGWANLSPFMTLVYNMFLFDIWARQLGFLVEKPSSP